MTYTPPVDDMRLTLRTVGDIEGLARLTPYAAATPDVVDAVLDEAGRLAADVLAPLNRKGDAEGARLENGVVTLPDGFKEAYRLFAEGGWNGLPFPEEHGGQGLPWALAVCVQEMWQAANMGFGLCPLLTQGAIEALAAHGDATLKDVYLPRLVAGEWTGAMCLTEPQAGSDLSTVRTAATRDGDLWRLRGTKIYITYGEHDLASNILHLVLARTEGGPPGTKGLSLFLVPKFLPNPDGSPGPRNDLRCASIEHKLGIHASPTCVMVFGDGEGAVGHLVGEEFAGMRNMFTMMNNARIAVGVQGLAIAERAYQAASAYARDRVQGRGHEGPAAIIAHPDVRRTLMTMKAQIGAMRALVVHAAAHQDRARAADDPAERERARGRVELLTPVVKAWCTDLALTITSEAIQVHGGMGFVEETGVAQHYRDARILPIYEGTNGIQALDLAGRKLGLAGGGLPWLLFEELRADLAALEAAGEAGLARDLEAGLARLEEATRWLQGEHDDDPAARAAGATPYLRLFGTTVGGFLLARTALGAGGGRAEGKRAAARFFARRLLPEAAGLVPAITAGSADLDPAFLDA